METPSIRVLPCWGILKYNKFNSIQLVQQDKTHLDRTSSPHDKVYKVMVEDVIIRFRFLGKKTAPETET